MTSSVPARRGRPEGHPDTASRVLAVARRLFGEQGYDATSVRKIATEAGVDPAVVHYHFGTKSQLFRTAIGAGSPYEIVVPPPPVARRNDRERADCITDHFLTTWESPEARQKLLALFVSAGTHEESADVLRSFVNGPLWTVHGRCDEGGELEKSLAAAQLLGVAMLRYVVKIEALVDMPVAALVERLSPVVSYHLMDGEEAAPGARGRAPGGGAPGPEGAEKVPETIGGTE